ncbi:MAG: CoA transferase [Gemmatimonadota bacterium]|nr:CoA transferase [Gemmatimonadota bacterium]
MPLKVVDLSRVLAGPLCGMILGDLGADVIKVEKPGQGDETRGYGPPFDDRGESAYFLAINRNKKSIAIDLSVASDRSVLVGLLAEADVVIDNFIPGKLKQLGLAPDGLLESNPRLVWCSISGFGPDSTRPGYDFVTQAESGWMSITGEPDGAPMKVGVALADVIAGKDAAASILGRILERNERPLPVSRRRIQISLLTSAVASLVNVAQGALVAGSEPRRWGNAHPSLVPYQLFSASDRPFVIAVGSDSQWEPCVRALRLSDLAEDPELAQNAGRVRSRATIVSAIAAAVSTNTAQHWVETLKSAGVPCGEVRTVGAALKSMDASALTGVASPVDGSVRLPPPRLDEHGAEVREQGWRVFAR